jgi:hypothetical protein
MVALLKNRLAYLSTSFLLFLTALPLISIGTTNGPPFLLWIGFAALCVGGLIPPVQRVLCAPKPSPASKADDEVRTKWKGG